ncbi:MAG TPA: DUF4350 domain-containing protein, partial [Gemmatimonadaceae bacterium]
SAKETGARGLYEAAARLGWPVARRTQPLRGELDTAAVWVALAPAIPATTAEVHALLESVRAGAGLLLALRPGDSPLSDSLGIDVRTFAAPLYIAGEDDWAEDDEAPDEETGEAPTPNARPDTTAPVSLVDSVLAAASDVREDPGHRRHAPVYSGEVYGHLRIRTLWPEDTVLFLAAERYTGAMPVPHPVAVGLTLGRGRIVVVAEPRIFMNDVVREGAGVLPVRMLEWLAPPGERRLVFDEFHHGYGTHASLGRATRRFLGETTVGRTIVQLLLAAALLVLALGARPFAPKAPERIERRSPIEHVGALAHAYDRVGASRVAARRLARGLRRRRSALGRPGSDAEYVRAIGERHPALAADVALVLDAMHRPIPPGRFVALAPAIARIERTLAS